MGDRCTFHENHYAFQLSPFVDRPWSIMEPLYIGDVPSWRGTPDCYCSVERNGKPNFLVNIYGSSDFGIQAVFWHSWLVIGSMCHSHFISLEKAQEIASFDIGYFCSFYPADDFLFVGSDRSLFCFNKDAQQRWQTQDMGMDGVEVTSVEDERVLGRGFCSTGSDESQWVPFVLSLATGRVSS